LPDRPDNGEPVAHHEVLPPPLLHAALLDGSLEMGYASWDRVAIRFTPAGEVVEAVTSETGGRALKVYVRDGEIIEEDIPCRLLEERVHSHSVST
jgi:dipeptidase E